MSHVTDNPLIRLVTVSGDVGGGRMFPDVVCPILSHCLQLAKLGGRVEQMYSLPPPLHCHYQTLPSSLPLLSRRQEKHDRTHALTDPFDIVISMHARDEEKNTPVKKGAKWSDNEASLALVTRQLISAC